MSLSKYQEWLEGDNLIRIQGWARDGLTDEQIAHNMGIGLTTLKQWKKKYEPIASVLKKNKEVVDMEVENALLKSAHGYDATEEVWERQFDPIKGEFELVLVKKTVKHIPASNTAQIFWLKNRKSKMWRERQEVEVCSDILNKAVDLLGGVESVID